MCTEPVPASSVTCSPKIIGDFLSTNGCLVFNNSKSCPTQEPITLMSDSSHSTSFKKELNNSWATTYTSPLYSKNVYSNLGCIEIAIFEGIVQGVVVQIIA